ncbi:MAG: hypothetical protein NT141_04520 [candidate division WWE3 bacterium]|nr:hypothetical protein [candidate division WWE3 bacterium]
MNYLKIASIIVGLVVFYSGIRDIYYFTKGFGLQVHILFNPYYAGVKPKATKPEKIFLLLQALVQIVAGVGLSLVGLILM